MNKLSNAIQEMNHLDTIATRNQWVNEIHPLVKLIITIFYIWNIVSFHKYDLAGLLEMLIYPLAVFILADLSIKESLYRLRFVIPVVCILGLANPFFDHTMVALGGIYISGGVLSMCTLMLKGIFTVLATYLLIATTTIEKICYALRVIHIPKVLVTQILLTYRYLSLLIEETHRISQAYALRAPKQKGIHYKAWGSLTGQLLMRSMDRAEVVYESMLLRGYTSEFDMGNKGKKFHHKDLLYLIIWLILIFVFRKFPIFEIVGNLFGGIIL